MAYGVMVSETKYLLCALRFFTPLRMTAARSE